MKSCFEERLVDGGSDGVCCGSAAPPHVRAAAKCERWDMDKRVLDSLVRTNLDVIIIGILLAWYHTSAVYASEESAAGTEEEGGHGSTGDDERYSTGDDGHGMPSSRHDSMSEVFSEEKMEVYAVLFPWFAEIVGVLAYYVLSRYAHAIPYTAIMFLVGTAIGIAISRARINAIIFSASSWVGIEGEVILLVFLPGLLYLDSYNIDVHLFLSSFWQLIIFAFPMVLGGTSLTALVAYYIFPFNWSFDLCMTFGSILAATDPVAVAVLLNELGAPPRMKMHISGESLLNDGSAVVFYHIFSLRFFYELGIEGVGHAIGWGEGFALFFRLSLGGTCIGVAFGVGLLIILYNLNHRLSGEDSVVQVVATITAAYLVFFTSEILCSCSGIIAVVFCGVTVKAFGETLYNDSHLSHHFWEITEYLLNTLLFTLGGCVWGEIISGWEGFQLFRGEDWGYLLLLYVFVVIIRFLLVFAFFPITSKIEIGSNWREAVFMSYGGLRGAVGIALALSLHAEVEHFTSADNVSRETREEFLEYTSKLFGMVGGIALLTLVINGPTSGPLLKRLGLVTPTETREKVIENYRQHMIQYTLMEYVKLLTEKRFQDVDFSVVKVHVPFLSDITFEQLMAAVRKHQELSPFALYSKPNLDNVIPYLYQNGREHLHDDGTYESDEAETRKESEIKSSRRASVAGIRKSRGMRGTIFDLGMGGDHRSVQEERLVYTKILHFAYQRLIDHGELEPRGFIVHTLFKSLEYAEDAASRGRPLEDWNSLEVASHSFARPAENVMRKLFMLKHRFKRRKFNLDLDFDFFLVQMKVVQILAFSHAHDWARETFKNEFCKTSGTLTATEKVVLDESDRQVQLAELFLSQLNEVDVALVKSHYACQILLNKAAYYFKKHQKHGLMSSKEACEFLEEIEQNIFGLLECRKTVHANEKSAYSKRLSLGRIPAHELEKWGVTIKEADDEAPPKKMVQHAVAKEHHEHLSQDEVDDLSLDGSDVVVSAHEVAVLRNTSL